MVVRRHRHGAGNRALAMPPTESSASHETPRSSRAWRIAALVVSTGAVVSCLVIAAVFAYVIMGATLSFEAY
jgi:hypothetical protein